MGVCIYNYEDTFILSLLEVIRGRRPRWWPTWWPTTARTTKNLQNDQIEELLESGVDALIVNPVDRTAAIYLIQMAMRYQKPIVLINREPLQEDLDLYDQAYYVGIDPKEQGLLSGQLAAQYFQAHPQADLSGDGVMQLVLLKGEPGHQDAELRTQYAMKALQESGVKVEKLAEAAALWERSLGQERMASFLNTFGERIECVLSNNDDMALGAIDALKAAGYFSGDKYMPVIGIDATAPAWEALAQGSLYGTVFNDAAAGPGCRGLAILLAWGGCHRDSLYDVHNKVVYIQSTSFVSIKCPKEGFHERERQTTGPMTRMLIPRPLRTCF